MKCGAGGGVEASVSEPERSPLHVGFVVIARMKKTLSAPPIGGVGARGWRAGRRVNEIVAWPPRRLQAANAPSVWPTRSHSVTKQAAKWRASARSFAGGAAGRAHMAQFGGAWFRLAGPDPLRRPAGRHLRAEVARAGRPMPVLGRVIEVSGRSPLAYRVAHHFTGWRDRQYHRRINYVFHDSPCLSVPDYRTSFPGLRHISC